MTNGHENLIPVQSEEEAREKGRKGGIASGKARREKRAVKKILSELLELPVEENSNFEKTAKKLGLESDKSIKELFVLVCLLNSLKKGNLTDIEKLMQILGEDTTQNNGVLENILAAVQGVDND